LFAATDPVAVVSLLKELGAPETLSVLIEGESLLNDGVGFVLFLVFFDQLSGRQDYDTQSVILKVIISSLSGGLIGVVLGVLSLMALQIVWEDGTLAVVITVITVWLTFFVCEMLEVSGVIGVVCLGLVYAAMSDGYIQVDVLADLKRFWQRIEYMANTLVFVYSGLVVLEVFSQVRGDYAVSQDDIVNLFVLFIMVNLIRGISVAVLFKPLKMLGGYGMSWDRVAVVSYAGLRGAVGLIGALLVFDEADCETSLPGEECIPFDTKGRM
jgi:sodium/hydrogen exchanger 10/11